MVAVYRSRLIRIAICFAVIAMGVLYFTTRSTANDIDTNTTELDAPKQIGTTGSVPSDKPKLTKEEILARFPKEKHEEFMRRAIANSRKAGVQYKTGGAFGAVIVT